jgi:putative transcriptional regulator
VIKVRLDEILEQKGRSAYWLSQATGINQGVLWKIRHGKTSAISFDILDRISDALECELGDLLVKVRAGKAQSNRKAIKSPAKKRTVKAK